MIFKKDLLKRIKSLESELGLVYDRDELNESYAEHYVRDYGSLRQIFDRLESLEKKEDKGGKK